MNNPLDIKQGTIFICGPVGNHPEINAEAFGKMELKLKELGYQCFNPLSNVQSLDIKKRFAFLTMCDKIVTLRDWEFDERCLKEVQISRILGKEVMMADKFFFMDNVFND